MSDPKFCKNCGFALVRFRAIGGWIHADGYRSCLLFGMDAEPSENPLTTKQLEASIGRSNDAVDALTTPAVLGYDPTKGQNDE